MILGDKAEISGSCMECEREMNVIFKRYKELFGFVFLYWIICFLTMMKDLNFLYVMLAWNVFLATLPLLFINFSLLKNKANKFIGSIVYFLLWFLFFPNSVYMITDFIHISNDQLIWFEVVERYSGNSGTMYSDNIMLWIKLLVIGIGVLYGLLIGLESLYIFYCFLNQKTFKVFSKLVIIGVSLISGIGVYIGRFLRFNSWDVLRPLSILRDVFINMDVFAIEFIFIFTIFILIIFILYTLFHNLARRRLERESKGLDEK